MVRYLDSSVAPDLRVPIRRLMCICIHADFNTAVLIFAAAAVVQIRTPLKVQTPNSLICEIEPEEPTNDMNRRLKEITSEVLGEFLTYDSATAVLSVDSGLLDDLFNRGLKRVKSFDESNVEHDSRIDLESVLRGILDHY